MKCKHSQRHKILDLLDSSGVIASTLCAIHCMALPIFFVLSPALIGSLHNPLIHLLMFAFVLPIALLTLGFSVLRSKRWNLFLLGLLGCAFLALGLELEHDHFAEELSFGFNSPATWSNIFGGLCLSAAHILNILARKKHETC